MIDKADLKKAVRTIVKTNGLTILFGWLITLVFVVTAFMFYDTPEGVRDGVGFKFLDLVHTNSIDLRMQMRGARETLDSEVVIIGIDERALESEGRWPWSRHKVSLLIEQLLEAGVKSVSTDIMFTEKSNEEMQRILREIPVPPDSIGPAAEKVKAFKETQLRAVDADGRFANTIKNNQNKLILSATYDHLRFHYAPFQNLCYELVYMESPYSQAWEREGYDVNVVNKAAVSYPEIYAELTESLENFLLESIARVEDATTEKFCSENSHLLNLVKDKADEEKTCPESLPIRHRRTLTRNISWAKREYCARWLKAGEDEYFDDFKEKWPEMAEREEIYAGVQFDDFVNGMKTSGLEHPLFPVDFWLNSIPVIRNAARYTGYLNAHPDSDGTIRTTPLIAKSGDQIIPSLAFRTSMVYFGADGARATMDESVLVPGYLDLQKLEIMKDGKPLRDIPVSTQGKLYINYAGPGYTFPHVSAKELMEPDNPQVAVTHRRKNKDTGEWKIHLDEMRDKKEFLKDKVAIIGGTAIGIYDLRVTPFDENFRGVETHANVVDSIINENYLRPIGEEPAIMLVLLFVMGIFLTLFVALMGPFTGVLTSIFIAAFVIWFDRIFLFDKGWVVAVVFPLLLVVAIYFGLTIFKYFTEEKKKRELRGTFEKYVSPAIVDEVMSDPANIELGGRKQTVTVFFSDVRGFTTISETLTPTELSDLLNEYLTPMTEIIFEYKGTLDKYIGDAIMAFFGAPIPHPNHPDMACRAALENISRLMDLQQELVKRNLPMIDVGIGLNTGEVSVGNMGSNIVRNYTIMGDAVNLGARLEGITKQYGVRIIISEYTKALISDSFITREVDCVKVKGKNKPVRIFELMGENEVPEQQMQEKLVFDNGYGKYHRRLWDEAIADFEKVLEMNSNDKAAKLFLDRCQEYKVSPPPEPWDGAFVMTTK